MSPQRIQRKRAKGWRMPENTVYVGRGTKWGNPFAVGASIPSDSPLFAYVSTPLHPMNLANLSQVSILDAERAVEAFEFWLVEQPHLMLSSHELEGKNLACWCKEDAPCHADVLLELANVESEL